MKKDFKAADPLKNIRTQLVRLASSSSPSDQKNKEKKYNIMDETFEVREKSKDQRPIKCFVIMPIGEEDTIEYENNMLLYDGVIKPSIESSGYNIECYQAEQISESGDISKQVIKALKDDDIVVADLRRKNPNVIYELGIRHAFGKRSILVCADHAENFFHTKKYRAIQYRIDGRSNIAFCDKLNKQIEAIIKNPEKPDNPVTDTLDVGINYTDKKVLKKTGKRKLYVSRIIKGTYSLGEIYNTSDDDIIDLDIALEYIDKTGVGQKVQAKVINSFDDPLRAYSHICHLIKKKEAKHIVSFPRTKTKVIIQGKVAGSDEIIKEEYDI